METGSGLVEYAKQFPDRYCDVGIAEEHAVTYCAGMARQGIKPILAIYSTFYNEVMINLYMMFASKIASYFCTR